MSEYTTVYQVTVAGLGAILACFLYSLGGRSGKWKRRFVASFVLTATLCAVALWRGNFDPRLLLTYLPLMGGFSLGYGAEELGQKIIKRLIYASAVLMAGVLCAWVFNAWWVLIPHVGVGMWSIYLGVKNPIETAAEEFFICLLLNTGLMMYLFV